MTQTSKASSDGAIGQAQVARHQPRQTQAAQDVEGVAADHVAHRDVAFALDGGGDAGGHLGHAGAGGHDGQADDEVAHAQGLGETDRGPHQVVRAEHQRHQADGDQTDLYHPVTVPGAGLRRLDGLGELVLGGLGLAARLHDQEHGVGHEQREQRATVQERQLAVQREGQQQQARTQHDRHLLPDQLDVDHQRRDQGADAQDEQHIEDVAAHHVADGDVGLAVEHGTDAHRDLGRAGAEGDDGQSHDERADAEGQSQLGRAAHEHVGAEDQQDQATKKHEHVHDRAL
jgi:hypothetical protein